MALHTTGTKWALYGATVD